MVSRAGGGRVGGIRNDKAQRLEMRVGYKEELGTFSFLPLCPPIAPSLKVCEWLWDPVSLCRVGRAGLDISRSGQTSQPLGRWEDRQGESDRVGWGWGAEEAGRGEEKLGPLAEVQPQPLGRAGHHYLPSEGHGNC